MEFQAEGRDMGVEFETGAAQPKITFRIAGTDAIDFVELVKLDLAEKKYERLGILNPGSEDCDGVFYDKNFKNDSMYYLRLRQQRSVRDREVWAWSSPIWVRKSSPKAAAGFPPLLIGFVIVGLATMLRAAGLRTGYY